MQLNLETTSVSLLKSSFLGNNDFNRAALFEDSFIVTFVCIKSYAHFNVLPKELLLTFQVIFSLRILAKPKFFISKVN